MSLTDVMLRTIAAEDDPERKLRFAASVLMARETEEWQDVHHAVMHILWDPAASPTLKDAAGVVLQGLATVLLGRVGVLDEGIEQLIDEVVEREVGSDGEPIHQNPDGSYTIALDPDPEDVPGDRDLFLDVWGEDGLVWLSLRVVADGGPRLTGTLDPESCDDLRRCLFLAAQDATEPEDAADQ